MSYYFTGYIIDTKNKKVLCEADFSILKNINEQSYSIDLTDVTPSGSGNLDDYPDIKYYKYDEFKGYFKKQILKEPITFGLRGYAKPDKKEYESYHVSLQDYTDNIDIFDKYNAYNQDDIASIKNINIDDYLTIYIERKEERKGSWFRKEDFENAYVILRKKVEDAKKELNRLDAVRFSKEYYEMSDAAKDNLFQDMVYKNEDIEDDRARRDTVRYIMNIFAFFMEDVYYSPDAEIKPVEKELTSSLSDKREIEIFLIVS